MSLLPILLILVLGGVAIYVIVQAMRPASDGLVILSGSQESTQTSSFSGKVPLSLNQPEGLVYTYSGWLLVRDFTTGYGQKRQIFSKGDSPGLYLDSTSNSMMVSVKTYGSTETILIPNIPAQKWIHFVVTVNQYAVDIYINGILRQHHTLSQLPDLTDDAIQVGGDWNGVLGRMSYYPRALRTDEIARLAAEEPPSDLYKQPARPQYFDMKWYINS